MSNIISVLVANQPGVLVRVAALFSRRNFNIHSLSVGTTNRPDISRITIVTLDSDLEQILNQLRKLPVVIAAFLLDNSPVARGLALFKLKPISNLDELTNIAHSLMASPKPEPP